VKVVRIVSAIEREIYDVSGHLGRLGIAKEREHIEGWLTRVRFSDGSYEHFFDEELETQS
jgi:hypothetical protein